MGKFFSIHRIIFVSILFFLPCHYLLAQKFSLGPMVGANITRIDGSGFTNGYNIGYHAGAFFALPVGKKLNAQMELYWSQVKTEKVDGFNAIYNNLVTQDFKDPKLEYLSIPLTLSFKPGKVISFQGGMQYSILINHNNSVLQNSKEAFNSGDVSALFGLQFHVSAFRFYLRYQMGLNDISNTDLNNEWKTSIIQLGTAIDFF
jgi:hypothetical protein